MEIGITVPLVKEDFYVFDIHLIKCGGICFPY